MGNKATQPLSFNTIRRSQTKVRAKRRKIQNIVLLAMFATVALILVTLLVFGGFAIVNAIIDARPNTPDNDNTPPQPIGTILFVQTTKSATDTLVGDLVLVNQYNKYTFPETTEKSLVRIYDYRAKTEGGRFCYNLVETQYKLKLQTNAIDPLNQMMLKSYEITGDLIKITDAYRTLQAQEGKDIDPGYSDHHTGYCFSIRYDNGDHIEQDHWIYQNAHKYGFIVRYPEGKENYTHVSEYTYCLRYVGVAHATYMYENNLCMEEYLDLLKNSYASAAMRLTIAAADGFDYDVYYVKASDSEISTIDVPTSDFTYTISGDNRGGFIVTVKKPVIAA